MKSTRRPVSLQLQHDELDVILPHDGSFCELQIIEAVRLLKTAETDEQRTHAQNEIEYWERMASESAQWYPSKTIPHIGVLFKRSCGRCHVVLDQKLENIRHGFVVTADHDPDAETVYKAFALIQHGNFGVGLFDDAFARNWHHIQDSLGKRLRALKSCPAAERAKHAKKLKQDLLNAVDRIAKPHFAKPRPNATQIPVRDETNTQRPLRLEILVIDTARKLAAKHQDTPSKGDIREMLTAIFPTLKDSKNSTWTDVWKRCGLDKLPTAAKWSLNKETTGKSPKKPGAL